MQSVLRSLSNANGATAELAILAGATILSWPNATVPKFESLSQNRLRFIRYRAMSIWPLVTKASRPGFEAFAVEQLSLGRVEGGEILQTREFPLSSGIFDMPNGTQRRSTGQLNGDMYPDVFFPVWYARTDDAWNVLPSNASLGT